MYVQFHGGGVAVPPPASKLPKLLCLVSQFSNKSQFPIWQFYVGVVSVWDRATCILHDIKMHPNVLLVVFLPGTIPQDIGLKQEHLPKKY